MSPLKWIIIVSIQIAIGIAWEGDDAENRLAPFGMEDTVNNWINITHNSPFLVNQIFWFEDVSHVLV